MSLNVRTLRFLPLLLAGMVLCEAQTQPNYYGQAPTGLPQLPPQVVLPGMPQMIQPPAFPAITGSTTVVATVTDLQTAVGNLQCGSAIQVQPGTYVFTRTLTVNVQCPAGSMALIYGAGIDMESSSTNIGRTVVLPSIQTGSSGAVFAVGNGSSGLYVAGLNFTTVTPLPYGVYPLVVMCDNDCTDESQVPANIWFDRVQVTAPNPPAATGPFVQRGLQPNCTNCGVINSAIWNIAAAGLDAQAILISNTPGPVLVWNNDLESSGENLMLNTLACQTGYCGYGLTDMPAPSAIVTGNHFDKQFTWENNWLGCVQGGTPECPTVKDELEIKHGQYVLVDHNVFMNDFAQAQAEFNIVNCFASGPYICNDIQFSSNVYEHGPTGIEINGNGTSMTGQRILIRNNVLGDINGAKYTAVGTLGLGVFFTMSNCSNCTVDHNTSLNYPSSNNIWQSLMGAPPNNYDLTFTNNIAYGELAAPPVYAGGVAAELANATWGSNLFVGDTWPTSYVGGPPESPAYPTGIITVTSEYQPANACPCNYAAYWPQPGVEVTKSISLCWSSDFSEVGFQNFQTASLGRNLAGAILSSNSPYVATGTDGMDPGANIKAVMKAVQYAQQ